MNTLSCLIVEDEHPAQILLSAYIAQLPSLHLVACCNTALQALELLRQQPIDILLLDINLPGLSGIDFLKILPNKPQVILITAYSEHAIEGYTLDVTDYLLKPVSFERFVQAINKVSDRIALQRNALQAPPPSNGGNPKLPLTEHQVRDHFFVKADYKTVKVRFDDILYIEGLREYVGIHTTNDRIITLESLRHLEEDILPPNAFMRVHKSFIVAIDKVEAIAGNELEIGKKNIPIGKNYREQVLQVFR
ncbi:MAG: response regulator transcription factor [Chitinophagales bacterium]|nr:response regulator transcription factor [Chitinophagales bacterium]